MPAGSEPMTVLLALAGLVVMGLALTDAAVTTLAVGTAAGPVTARSSRALAQLLQRVAAARPRVRPSIGPVVLVATIAQWIALLWAGWALVLLSSPDAVVAGLDGAPVGGWSRVYFASYTLFTLGNGEFVPGGDVWRLATAVATVLGFALATASITYLVPVVTAVTDRHAQAQRIAALGGSAQAIALLAWNGQDFCALSGRLEAAADEIVLTAERHMTYPVLHYFAPRDRSASLAVNVAALDEAVGIIRCVVPASAGPSSVSLSLWDHAVERLLAVVEQDVQGRGGDPPPDRPTVAQLVGAGVPFDGTDEFVGRLLVPSADRRRRLHDFVRAGGWSWADVADT